MRSPGRRHHRRGVGRHRRPGGRRVVPAAGAAAGAACAPASGLVDYRTARRELGSRRAALARGVRRLWATSTAAEEVPERLHEPLRTWRRLRLDLDALGRLLVDIELLKLLARQFQRNTALLDLGHRFSEHVARLVEEAGIDRQAVEDIRLFVSRDGDHLAELVAISGVDLPAFLDQKPGNRVAQGEPPLVVDIRRSEPEHLLVYPPERSSKRRKNSDSETLGASGRLFSGGTASNSSALNLSVTCPETIPAISSLGT